MSLKRQTKHQEANETAAAVILTNPERYGGEGSGLVQWAQTVSRQARCTIYPARPDCYCDRCGQRCTRLHAPGDLGFLVCERCCTVHAPAATAPVGTR